MIITAKFPATCPKCSRGITPGAKVQWERGAKATHVACPADVKSPRKSSAPRKSFPSVAPEAGAVLITARRSDRHDRRYEVGGTIHAPRVSGVGGGPDGHYYTVLISTLTPPCEDNGEYDWRESAWVRPATDGGKQVLQAPWCSGPWQAQIVLSPPSRRRPARRAQGRRPAGAPPPARRPGRAF
jgi:hypothetical protein